MNITFLVNFDIASTLALNYLLPKLAKHNVCVYFTHKKLKKTDHRLAELANFEAKTLDRLNKSSSTQKHKSIQQLSVFCTQPIAKLNNVNGDDFDQIRSNKTDLIISIRHMTILQDAIIKLPKHGVINLHSGLIPSYQGVMASFWAMLNDEKFIGTSLHYIEDSNIDTGTIITQSQQKCDYTHSYLWNVLNLYQSGSEMILSTIDKIDTCSQIEFFDQQGEAQYFSFPTEIELSGFADKGNVLFDQKDLIDFNLN